MTTPTSSLPPPTTTALSPYAPDLLVKRVPLWVVVGLVVSAFVFGALCVAVLGMGVYILSHNTRSQERARVTYVVPQQSVSPGTPPSSQIQVPAQVPASPPVPDAPPIVSRRFREKPTEYPVVPPTRPRKRDSLAVDQSLTTEGQRDLPNVPSVTTLPDSYIMLKPLDSEEKRTGGKTPPVSKPVPQQKSLFDVPPGVTLERE